MLLSIEATLSDAIQKLDQSPFKTVFVVDNKNILVGSLTDGDVRRSLLTSRTLDINVQQVINSSPITVEPSLSKAEIKKVLTKHGIKCVPIVDDGNHIIAIESLESLSSAKDQSNTVFIMAGGFGKRLRPLTNSIPKPMLQIDDKPILQIILEQFRCHGFSKFVISTHYRSEVIKSFFKDGADHDVNITYIDEKVPLGTAGSLGYLVSKTITDPLIIMNADLLVKLDFRSLLDFHNENSADLTICGRHFSHQIPYGVIHCKEGVIVEKIIEKPIEEWLVSAGIYILNPELLKEIQADCYLDMPDFIDKILSSGAKVCVYPLFEYWIDIGKIENFEKAQQDVKYIFPPANY